MSKPFITLDRIAVRQRDRWMLKGLSWRINEGELWAVVGPNGSGKTTLAKAVAGLLPVVQGKIRYHGLERTTPVNTISYVASDDRRDLWRRERELDRGRSFAGRFFNATLVRDWICAGACCSVVGKEKDAIDIIEEFTLGGLLGKPLMALSTGEMSRVLLARELFRQPQLLILDEPFDGLDLSGREELREALDGLAVSNLPMIFITHRPEEMLTATTHVLTIDEGRIIRSEPVDLFFSSIRIDHALSVTRQISPLPYLKQEKIGVTPSSEPMIEMNAVTVRYGHTTVLDRIDWTVRRGEHWAVTGPNGAGKSTLLKLITGECLQVFANRIRLFGKDRGTGQTLWETRQQLGVVSHELGAGYQKEMSALDVVCSGFFDSVGLYRQCDADQLAIAKQWMARLNISFIAHTFFNRLSQGQRQMVLIARAMVKSPRLLILDEPCAGLDMQNRRKVLDLVDCIVRIGVTGLLFITHHEKEIPIGMTHCLHLDQGTIVKNRFTQNRSRMRSTHVDS